MDAPFPADVSLRVTGELADAQPLFPVARTILQRALALHANGLPVVRLFAPIPGVGLVSAFVHGDIKHLYVQPIPNVKPRKDRKEEAFGNEAQPFSIYSMLSGAAVGFLGTAPKIPRVRELIIDGDTVVALDSFHPSGACATAYGLANAWQYIERLNINDEGARAPGAANCAYPKASMFSGVMKNVVQAIHGIGYVEETDTVEYLTGELPPTEPSVVVWNRYDWKWLRTHGVTFGADNTPWLVEINKDEGVLAMPLSVFNGTDGDDFVRWLNSIGDVDTAYAVSIIGGLPTSEPMPTGTSLTDAIAAGLVLRLMSAEELAPFYVDPTTEIVKAGCFDGCGWAFAPDGRSVVNTAFWYSDAAEATAETTSSAPVEDRYMRSELWSLSISISQINNGEVTAENPIGNGSATLQMIDSGLLWSVRYESDPSPFNAGPPPFYVPSNSLNAPLTRFMFYGNQNGYDPSVDDAPVYAFFKQDGALEVVRQRRGGRAPTFSGGCGGDLVVDDEGSYVLSLSFGGDSVSGSITIGAITYSVTYTIVGAYFSYKGSGFYSNSLDLTKPSKGAHWSGWSSDWAYIYEYEFSGNPGEQTTCDGTNIQSYFIEHGELPLLPTGITGGIFEGSIGGTYYFPGSDSENTAVGTAIPSFCRESVIFFAYDKTNVAGVGDVVSEMRAAALLGSGTTIAFPTRQITSTEWLFWFVRHSVSPAELVASLVENCGVSGGAILANGVYNTEIATLDPPDYIVTPEVSDLEFPESVTTDNSSFVGAP